MNILWISHNIPYPPKGGVLQRNHNLLKEVASKHSVYLIAFNQKALLQTEKDVVEAKLALKKFCTEIVILSIPSDASRFAWYKLVLLSLFIQDPYTVNWLKSTEMHLKIKEAIQKIKFDSVYYDTISLAEYSGDSGSIPKFLNHHNIESDMMHSRAKNERNFLKKIYFHIEAIKLRKYEDRHCKNFDINITVSAPNKDLLQGILPDSKVEVIPNGVDTKYFYPGNESLIKQSLIFVGGMNWYPNWDAVIYLCKEIWPLLKKEISDIRLTVVGVQPPKELLDLARGDDNVLATGFVEDVRPYLRSAEIFICPIRDGGGTRLKILDALSMGKAIVTTTKGCEGIDVEPGKNVLIANKPQEFVAQVKKVLANPELRELLGREGRKLVETKYSWKTIGTALNMVLEYPINHKLKNHER